MAYNVVTDLLRTAVREAPVLPRGLVEHTLDPTNPIGATVAVAACRRTDLDLDLRTRLTLRAAREPKLAGVPAALADLVSAQIIAGADPLSSLQAALATPAGSAEPQWVLDALWETPARELVTTVVLSSHDSGLLRHASRAGWAPLELAAHLSDLWDSTASPQLRKMVATCGALLMPKVADVCADGFEAWWASVSSDELVLLWAARCSGQGDSFTRLRRAAAERVLPAWFAGALPGVPVVTVKTLVEGTLQFWTRDFLTDMAGKAHELTAKGSMTRDIVKRISSEVRRRDRAQAQASVEALVSSPLGRLYTTTAVAAWLVEQVPDHATAWEVVTQLSADQGSSGSSMSLSDLVAVAQAVLA